MTFTRLDLLYFLLPALLLVLLVRWRRGHHFLGHIRLHQLADGLSRTGGLVFLPRYLQWLALLFLIVAVLNPVLTFAEQQLQLRGLDIVLVIDLSASMQQALPVDAAEAAKYINVDPFFINRRVNPSRLDAVKGAIKNFIRYRQNDRIGLVVFSSNAYVVSPMSRDYEYLTQYIDMMDQRTLVGEGMTSIGEGIYGGLHLLQKQNEKRTGKTGDRLLVVLSDGENNYGRSPVLAAADAKAQGAKIYMIGVDVPVTALTNEIIAGVKSGGGAYFDVRNQEQLNHAYWEIGALEKGDFVVKEYERGVPFYQHAVLAAFVCLGISLALRGLPYFTELT